MEISISVIVSIYNIEKYISECIDSVLGQTYMPCEVILVNDGSTDSSLEICQEYKKRHPALIKVLKKKNGGLSSARNAGLKASMGGYIYFIDGDDYILPQTLESFVEILTQYGELDFIHGRMSYFSDNSKEPKEQPFFIDNSWERGPSTGQQLFADAYKYQGGLAMGVRGLYNKNFLKTHNLFFLEKKFSWPEDEEWTPKVFYYAKRVAGNRKALYCYRENRPGSESTKLANLDAALLALEIYNQWNLGYDENYFKEGGFYKAIKQEAGRRYVWCVIANSRKLADEEVEIFLAQANRYKKMAINAGRLSGRQLIFKWIIYIFGAKLAGHLYRTLRCSGNTPQEKGLGVFTDG